MAAGWQHPETTWTAGSPKDGASWAARRLGGEAMMELAPDGLARGTFLNLAASTLADTGTNVNKYFVGVLGGYTSYIKSLKALADLAPASPF